MCIPYLHISILLLIFPLFFHAMKNFISMYSSSLTIKYKYENMKGMIGRKEEYNGFNSKHGRKRGVYGRED